MQTHILNNSKNKQIIYSEGCEGSGLTPRTENGETTVVTYLISVREKIENHQLSGKPAPRMSVWKKIDGQWQWIAHANLKEIPANQPKTGTPAPKKP